MLDPGSPATAPVLWVVLVVLVAAAVARTIHKDRREYGRFKRFRSTAKRQRMMRKWVFESLALFGGSAAVALLLAGGFVAPLLADARSTTPIRQIVDVVSTNSGIVIGVAIGAVAGLVALTAAGIRAARGEGDVPAIGDIQALLPRNRQELGYGAALSINAGVVEELLFRLALPAVIYGASGNATVAIVVSIALFGALHAYQGLPGILGTGILGALLMLSWLVSGTILVPIVLHALLDLRSLVLIPVTVFGAHRIDGRVTKFIPRRPVRRPEPPDRSVVSTPDA